MTLLAWVWAPTHGVTATFANFQRGARSGERLFG